MISAAPAPNTAPAMPASAGMRISVTPSPLSTRENNSPVSRSCRNSVARSASSALRNQVDQPRQLMVKRKSLGDYL